MSKKIELDPNKVEYDGGGFKIVVNNEDDFWNRLKSIQDKIGLDLEKSQLEEDSHET